RLDILGDRFFGRTAILEHDPEIETSGGMVRVERERLAIQALRVLERTRLVAQPSEIDPRGDVIEIGLEHAAVGELRFAVRADLLAFERGLEELLRVAGRVQRALHRVARERRDLLAELAYVEVEQRLLRLGLPARAVVSDDHAVAVDLHAHGAQRPIGGQLLGERAQRAQDPARLELRILEPLRGAQQHEILERKLEMAARSGTRSHDARAHQGAHALRRNAEQVSYLSRGIRLHGVRATWQRRASSRRAWIWQLSFPQVAPPAVRACAHCRRRGSL